MIGSPIGGRVLPVLVEGRGCGPLALPQRLNLGRLRRDRMIAIPLRVPRRPPQFRLLAALVAAVGVFSISACSMVIRPPAPPTAQDSLRATENLNSTLADHWTYVQEEWPELASQVGLRVIQLPPAMQDLPRLRRQFAVAALRALDRTNIQALTQEQYVSWLTLRWDLEALSRRAPFADTDLSLISPAQSPLRSAVALLRLQALEREEDADYYLLLVEAVVPLIDSIHAGLVDRAGRGVVLSREAIPHVVSFVRWLAAPPASSPFGVATERLAALDTTVRQRFGAELESAIRLRVVPRLEQLAAYLETDYTALAPALTGVGQYAGGLEHYRLLVQQASTLEISPEAAHEAGLQEVARLSAWARQARQAAGLPVGRDSLRAILQQHAGLQVTDSLSAQVTRLVNATTLDSSVVRELPASGIALDTLPASDTVLGRMVRYIPPSVPQPVGQYTLHAPRWRRSSLLTVQARVYEDILPGRHVQVARQRENATLPLFRRLAHHPGFVDGWSAYALELSDSLLTRGSAMEQFGIRLRLLALACGLVVDTGINYFGWTTAEAMTFLRSHLPDDDEALRAEFILPALEDPASLVAATLGGRELRGLRRWAERELGDRFELAAFHEQALAVGSVPLPVLGTQLEWWVWRLRSAVPDSIRPPGPR